MLPRTDEYAVVSLIQSAFVQVSVRLVVYGQRNAVARLPATELTFAAVPLPYDFLDVLELF